MKERPASWYRFVIASVVSLERFSVSIITAVWPLLPLIMRELNISRGTVSWFVSAPQLLTMVFAVPAGILANRIGLKKTYAAGAFLHAVGIITPLCLNFPMLLVTRILFGLGTAISMPLAAGIIAQWFGRKERPLANGLSQVSGSLGQTLAFFITIPLSGVLSWRGTLASYSALALIAAFLWAFLGMGNPRAVFDNPGERPMQITRAPVVKMSTWQVLRQRETLLLALSLTGAFCLYLTLNAWLPPYYYEVFKMPLAKASSVSAIFKATGIPAVIIGGILPMRLGRRKPLIVVSGLMVGIMGLATFIVNNPAVIFTALAIYGFFGVLYMPVIYTIPMELPGMTPETGSLVLAVALSAGYFGGFMGPVIVGYLADFTGSYLAGFLICCALSFSLLIGGLLLPETGPRGIRNTQPVSVRQA